MRRGIMLLCLCFGCASAPKAPPWEHADPMPPGPYGDADRVVLLLEEKVDFHLEGGHPVADFTEHFKGAAVHDHAVRWNVAHAEYNRQFEQLRVLRARVIRANGTIETADESRRVELPSVQRYLLYSDTRSAALLAPTPAVGDVFESESTTRALNPLLFGGGISLRGPDPIASLRVELRAPQGWEIELGWRDGPPHEVKREVLADGSTKLSLQLHEVAAMTVEPLSHPTPPTLLFRLKRWTEGGEPRVAFADAREFSRAMFQMMHGADVSDPELDAVAARIAAQTQDPESRARAAHQWVCEKIQYCAIAIGSGGWIPHPAGEVYRLGYGDCKDKAMLLHVLLGRLGVRSSLSLLFAHPRGPPRPFGLPSMSGNFNHVILQVELPRGTLFTDPTAEFVPFAQLPPADLDSDTLPITENGAELAHTPSKASDDDQLVYRLKLHRAGDALAGTYELDAHGLLANSWRDEFATHLKSAYGKNLCDQLHRGCRIEGLELAGLEKGAEQLTVKGQVTLDRGFERVGERWTLRPQRFGDWGFDAPAMDTRLERIELGSPRTGAQEVTVAIAPDAEVTLPPPFAIDFDFASYRLSWSAEPGSLTFRRELTRRSDWLAPEHWAKVVELSRAIRDAEARAVVVKLEPAK